MNPLRWPRERQIAGFIICLIGGIAGLLFAWSQSPIYLMTDLSREWNSAHVFLVWLRHAYLYWPWPILGALLSGLAFYVYQLLDKPSN